MSPPAARSADEPPVIVIGGGFAGLAAATALAEVGVTVHVLDARPGLGGRATAYRDPVTGERIDNGQHVLAGCYDETLAFLRRIGTTDRLHRPSALRVPMIDERGRTTALTLPPLPAPLHLIAGVLAWEALTLGDRWSVLRLAGPLRRLATAPPPAGARRETVRQWLTRHGQSPRLCHLLWEPLALAALNQSVDDAAADSFCAVIGRMFGPDSDAATLLVPAVPLDDLYAHPAVQFLRERGSPVTTNARARIEIAGDRAVGVRACDQRLPAAAVVSAVPWHAFRDLFDEPPASLEPIIDRADRLASVPIVTVNLWLDGPVLDDLFVGLPGRTFQWVFNRRLVTGGAQTHLSLVSSGAETSSAAANDALVTTAMHELTAALPAVRARRLRHASVVRERRATFSLRPGAPARPPAATPIDRLVLAGDWIDTGLPATIESAVLSGHQAARAVLRRIG